MEQNEIQINGGIMINVDMTVKNIIYVKNIYDVWNPDTCNCENGKCLASIMDDSVTTCDEFMESFDEKTKTIPTNFSEKEVTCKMLYILLAFLLITIALLIIVSIYCYLIKY